MSEITANVNWIAVAVGTVVAFALGGLWYSPKMFGAKWAEGVGMAPDGADGQPTNALIAQLVATFLLAWVVGVTAKNDALFTILLIAVTIAALMAAGGMFARKGSGAIAVEASFVLAMVVVMILVHAIL